MRTTTDTPYLALVRSLSPFPLLADVAADVAAKVQAIREGARGPTMSQQCKMAPRDAATWQAALILTGRRKVHTSSQTKLDKATETRSGYRNRGLTMATAFEASAFISGKWDACPGATDACRFACVGSQTGQGRLSSSLIARVGRTLAMLHDLDAFLACLDDEVSRLERAASRKGYRLAFRTNVSTDHPRLAAYLAEKHPSVDFYDYTAVMANMRRKDGVRRIYSRKDGRTEQTMRMLSEGHGVCVVFDVTARSKGPLPATWEGYDVIDGDIDDLWFTRAPDSGPFVVGLRVKATTADQLQRTIASGFAVAA